MSNTYRGIGCHFFLFFAVLSLVLIPACGASDWTPQDFPDPTTDIEKCGRTSPGWVCDPEHILSPKTRDDIEATLRTIHQDCHHDCPHKSEAGFQVAVAVMNHIDRSQWKSSDPGTAARDFAIELGNKWGVGNKDCKDGMVLVVSKLDRGLYFLIGAGARGAVSDNDASIIVDKMKGHFKEGEFDEGITEGLGLVYARLQGEDIGAWSTAEYCWLIFFVFFILVSIWPYIVGLILRSLIPVAKIMDWINSKWARPRVPQATQPTNDARAALGRIQREVEGMESDVFEQKMCPICLEDFTSEDINQDKLKRLPECKHVFHYECIREWVNPEESVLSYGLNGHNSCPLCRAPVDVIEEEDVDDDSRRYQNRLRFYLARLAALQRRGPASTGSNDSNYDDGVCRDSTYLLNRRHHDWTDYATNLYVMPYRLQMYDYDRHTTWMDRLNAGIESNRQTINTWSRVQGSGSSGGGGGDSSWGGGGGFGADSGGAGGSW